MTQEKRPSVKDRILLDVNALAIFLVEDHPGNPHIGKEIKRGLEGRAKLLVYDYLPLRVHWILTSKWRIARARPR